MAEPAGVLYPRNAPNTTDPLSPDLFLSPPNTYRPLPGIALSLRHDDDIDPLNHIQNIGAGGGSGSLNPGAERIDTAFGGVCESLIRAQRDYDMIEEEVFASAQIVGNQLQIGDERYRVVVLPTTSILRRATLDKMRAFAQAGGILLGVSPLPTGTVEQGTYDGFTRELEELFTTGRNVHLVGQPAALVETLNGMLMPDVALSPAVPDITYYHRTTLAHCSTDLTQ